MNFSVRCFGQSLAAVVLTVTVAFGFYFSLPIGTSSAQDEFSDGANIGAAFVPQDVQPKSVTEEQDAGLFVGSGRMKRYRR